MNSYNYKYERRMRLRGPAVRRSDLNGKGSDLKSLIKPGKL